MHGTMNIKSDVTKACRDGLEMKFFSRQGLGVGLSKVKLENLSIRVHFFLLKREV